VTRAPAEFYESGAIAGSPYEGEFVHGAGFAHGHLDCDSCCAPAVSYPPLCGDMMWAELEFLLWWRSGRFLPPLATGAPGALPQAPVLFGGGEVNEQARPGGRLGFGWWLDPCQTVGIGGSFVAVGNARNTFFMDSTQTGFLGRPFFDTDPGAAPGTENTAQVIFNITPPPAGPGTTGEFGLVSDSDFMAADAFMRCIWLQGPMSRVDFIFGYQFGRIDESLIIDTLTISPTPGPTFTVRDSLLTQNEFHGGHFGLKGQYRWGALGLDLSTKAGFGNMSQRALLAGETDGIAGEGGLLVQPSNAGMHQRDEFSYMHDVGVKLTYYPVEQLKLSVGYSMVFFSDVLRPGDQIETIDGQPAVDSRWFTGQGTRPEFNFNSTHFYLHGLNVGLECRF
jgi:hypothetical protein